MDRLRTSGFRALMLALCCLVALGGWAMAQGPAATGAEAQIQSEVSVKILVTTGILLAGILVARVLFHLKVIKSYVWVLPILVVVAGIVLGVMAIAGYRSENSAFWLVCFLFSFLLFVTVLYGVAHVAIPSAIRRTRGGLPPLIRGVAVLVLAFLGLLAMLTYFFPAMDLKPLFVTSGVVSLVIGLSVQGLLGNLLAGLVLSVQRPFSVGHWIRVKDTEGEVTETNWRATVVRTRQNDYVAVPNSAIMREDVTNYDEPSSLHLRKVYVGVTYATPPGLSVSALLEAAERVEGVLDSPASEVHFHNYEESSLLYELRIWIDNYASMPEIESEVRKEIWYAFKRHGITMPFPQRDVNMRQVVEPPKKQHARLVAATGLPHGTTFELDESRVTIGRDPESGVWLNHPQVSTEHAVIEKRGDDFFLSDLGSRHGTRLNGQRTKSSYLEQGDELAFGPITLVYESHLAPAVRKTSRRRKRTTPPADAGQAEGAGKDETA